jgi:2-polyprenyl-3-methyl-5-hydroxy-6-metoxy-1,4-benzoquinol methylase
MKLNRFCIICGSKESELIFIREGIKFIKCKRCELVNIEPLPSSEEAKKIYSKRYFKSPNSIVCGYEDYIRDKDDIVKTFQKRFKTIEKFSPVGKILDVGCAMGFLLEIAKDKGWETYGVEVSEYAAKYAQKELGSNVFLGDINQADFKEEFFDVVIAWDTLEHVVRPVDFIKEINRILKTGGVVSIITPNVESIPAKILGSKWVEFKKPQEHFFYFSASALAQLLEDNGFKIVFKGSVGKVVSLGFIINRLRTYNKHIFGFLSKIINVPKLENLCFYLNPMDKIHLCAQKLNSI